MTTRNQDIGANLEELSKGGTRERPPIADSIHRAGSLLSGEGASAAKPLSHHAELGLGAAGPVSGYDELRQAIASCAKNSGDVMGDVGSALVKTAQKMAITDDEIRQAFIKRGPRQLTTWLAAAAGAHTIDVRRRAHLALLSGTGPVIRSFSLVGRVTLPR